MNPTQNRWRTPGLIIGLILLGLVGIVFFLWPRNPIARIQVIDASGKPIAGAIVRGEGLRTKQGPYRSGWYGWKHTASQRVTNRPVKTDSAGYARLEYPKYVFERIETGALCLGVRHPEYVLERPERDVSDSPPKGAPWRVWIDYLWARARLQGASTQPIVLRKGGRLTLTVANIPDDLKEQPLYAQVSGENGDGGGFWSHPQAGVVTTTRLAPGRRTIRTVIFDAEGASWFSDDTNLDVGSGQSLSLALPVRKGVSVRGKLDSVVPRPVMDGKVIAKVWPSAAAVSNSPPQWHTYTKIQADGSFEFTSLPSGVLELVAICDGYISTNGPGQFPGMHYPQTFRIEDADSNVVLGMEATGTVKVEVRDDADKPLAGATVSAWPNVRYGEWFATVVGGDAYDIGEMIRHPEADYSKLWLAGSRRFERTTDGSGVALLANLPKETKDITVRHDKFQIPALDTGYGQKRREALVTIISGATNTIRLQMEPMGQSEIRHY